MPMPVEVLPDDEFNRRLVSQVHPPDWTNPVPRGRYNLVVIGAGTAGLVTAAGAAGLGAKVALVERHLMGGDCLNVGCVPSKALLRAARAAAAVREAGEFGVDVPAGVHVDFAAVMQRMRQLRAGISPHDSAARFRELGVDVFLGDALFRGPDSIEVRPHPLPAGDTSGSQNDTAGPTLGFKRAVIATGGRAAVPPVPGLDQVAYLTNETIFSLTELPRKLAVLGAGPIGCELAQAFARFGSQVILIEAEHGVLPKEDEDAADIVQQALLGDGVTLLCCGKRTSVERGAEGGIRIRLESHDENHDLLVDQLLVATGRAPNVETLDLERAGVAYDRRTGIEVDDRLRTSNSRIYAAGDVCSKYQFTHLADFQARLVIQNALFHGRAKASALTIPWCTYTEPEVAHVGLYEAEARDKGLAVQTFVQPLSDVDRAVIDGQTAGFVKVHVKQGTDTIVGATIVADRAGELISEITLALVGGLGLKTIGRTIHPYPTQAEAIRKLGDAYNRTRLTPFVKSLFQKWLAWTR